MRRRIISKTDNTVLMPPSSNRIKYTTSDNKIISVSKISENENIISNTYVENFGGIIELDGILTGMYPRLFYNKVTLTRVILPNTLNYITYGAFENCKSLEEIILSDNVINIYKQAFTRCINLRKIHIGRSVESLGYEDGSESLEEYTVFSHCSNINEITIDPLNITYSDGSDSEGANVILDKNTKTILVGCKNSIIPTSALIIGYSAFSECIGMVSITIPSNISEIKELAFYECSDLKTIIFESTTPATIPTDSTNAIFSDSLEKIIVPHESIDLYKESWPIYADKIFSNALFVNYTTSDGNIITPTTNAFGDAQIVSNTYSNGIGIIELDKPCTVLKDSAFNGITTLTSFKIPESVTIIERSAFNGCFGLTSITIPDTVTSIGNNAFFGCYDLISITIGNSVTSIGSSAFYNCSGLTSVVIPNSVTSIEIYTFRNCSGLTSITIPDSVTRIGEYAFAGCSGLTSITIPDSVTIIRSYAFEETAWYKNQPDGVVYAGKVLYRYKGTMSSNTSIIIEDGTLGIVEYAFRDCSGLTSITIPNSVTSIGSSAFRRCSSLTSITIGNSVTSIGNYAFSDCTNLTNLIIKAIIPPTIYTSTFSNVSKLIPVYVPSESVNTYKSAQYWSEFTNIQEIEE